MRYTGDRENLSKILEKHLQRAISELPDEILKMDYDHTGCISYQRIGYVYLVLLEIHAEKPDEPLIQHRVGRLEALDNPLEV